MKMQASVCNRQIGSLSYRKQKGGGLILFEDRDHQHPAKTLLVTRQLGQKGKMRGLEKKNHKSALFIL